MLSGSVWKLILLQKKMSPIKTELPKGQVMVTHVSLDPNTEDWKSHLSCLSIDEQKKVLQFHYEGDKKIKTKAITYFTLLDSNTNYSLLELNPKTGRKHQLRKQLLIHGCPILGDTKYRTSLNYTKKKNTLMLHAHKVNFSIAGSKYNFSANS